MFPDENPTQKPTQSIASVPQSEDYSCKEAIRDAGRAEVAAMSGEKGTDSKHISVKPPASSGWGLDSGLGLELLLPGLSTARSAEPGQDPPPTQTREMSPAVLQSTLYESIRSQAASAGLQSPQSTLYQSARSQATSAGLQSPKRSDREIAAKDRFQANLAKLKKFQK
jgi:hypothetical protein